MSGLILNFIELKLQEDNFKINSLPYLQYDTKEKYANLRTENRDFHFYRDNDKIFYWTVKDVDDLFNGEKEEINTNDNPFVINRIIETAIVNFFREQKNINVFLNKYSQSWILESNKDLLSNQIEGLSVIRQIKIKATFLSPADLNIFGILIDPETKTIFRWKKSELIKNGIDITGLKGKDEIIFANKVALNRFLIARGAEDKFKKLTNNLNKNEKNFELIKDIYGWLNKQTEKIYLPSSNKIRELTFNYLPTNNNGLSHSIINNPIRYFYSGSSSNQRKSYNELVKQFKPFSYELFSTKKIKIGILAPKQYEGSLEKFILDTENILKNDIHLSKINFETVFTDGLDLDSYKHKIYDSKLESSDIVFVVVNEEHKKLPVSKSPYYLCKAKFIGMGIPTQDIKIENIRRLNQFIMNNISLNVYAKIGGTAWTIERDEKIKEELVIGIGSTTDENNQTILGIAQVFNSDGQYLVGSCSPLSTKENYSQNLENYLYATLTRILENQINQDNEFRLIFHLFKSASNEYEITAIENALKRFSSLKFKYALLHLSYGHNFNLYFNDGKGEVTKGLYLELDRYRSLLHFIPKSRIPLQIILDKRSTYLDIFDLTKQVFWFSNLSHRSYNPSKKTVTLMYPSLMASMTEKLKIIDGWDYDRLNFVSEKLWFI